MNYHLPTSLEVAGRELAIRSDFRPVLDTVIALDAPELNEWEKVMVTLHNIYVDPGEITDVGEAFKKAMWFIAGGKTDTPAEGAKPKIFDWEQDWELIVAALYPIVHGDVRAKDYFHWWSFTTAFMEIGESTFSTVLSIRRKKQKGKKLEKYEQEFMKSNPGLVKLRQKVYYSPEERELLGIDED